MKHGEFIWYDLSAYDKEKAQSFYGKIFNWGFQPLTDTSTSDYTVAKTKQGETAGVFTMPEKFQKIGLPSFWMSYIAVDDIQKVTELAQQHGGKVELGPIPFDEHSEIALIRDPLGAGFTVYMGKPLLRANATGHGHHIGQQLYVSNATAVIPFYEILFDWNIKDVGQNTHEIRSVNGGLIAHIHEMEEEKRGKFEFWGVEFATNNQAETKRIIEEAGGECGYEDKNLALYYDLDGAGFFTREISQVKMADTQEPLKWKSLIGLCLVFLAIFTEFDPLWGLLFFLWTLPVFQTGAFFYLRTSTNVKTRFCFGSSPLHGLC